MKLLEYLLLHGGFLHSVSITETFVPAHSYRYNDAKCRSVSFRPIGKQFT